MQVTRRDLIKAQAVSAAATVIGISVPGAQALAQTGTQDGVRWDKGVCRFCGTGCGVLIGTKDNKIVATQGDPDAPVNKGLNCIKGYFLSKIMYGKDRLTEPLLRMKDGKYDKNGEFAHVSWDQAFDVMADKCKAALKAKGPRSVGMFGSGQWTIWEGYAAVKLFKAGFRSNNLDPNARHCMASAVAGFMRTFAIDEPMGCYDDAEHADAFVLWGANMAEMHPILWSRITDRHLTATHVKLNVLSTFSHRSCELADSELIFKPQSDLAILNYICNHIIQSGAVDQDFIKKNLAFRKGVTDIGYGLRPKHPLEQVANNSCCGPCSHHCLWHHFSGSDRQFGEQPLGYADSCCGRVSVHRFVFREAIIEESYPTLHRMAGSGPYGCNWLESGGWTVVGRSSDLDLTQQSRFAPIELEYALAVCSRH